MHPVRIDHLEAAVAKAAYPLTGAEADYDPVLDLIGDARLVLLGEASHGTHEFYAERAAITWRLIREKGFTAVAVEADWPDAYRVNRYVRAQSQDATAESALSGFKRFPMWMWRNADVLSFVSGLRTHNDALPAPKKIGFYGLDLYSLHASMEAVLNYLHKMDPKAARAARVRYACFDHYGEDPQAYGYAAGFGMAKSCEDDVIAQLTDLRRHADEYLRRDGFVAEDEFFYAEQNARLVKNVEAYYRAMFGERVSSWNLRDRHMSETLIALERHLARRGAPPKIVVWEHNSHLGDARATQMAEGGELNVGQLIRERYGNVACLIGFTTYTGTVTAATEWDEPPQRKTVRPALPGSYEALFHQTGLPRLLLTWTRSPAATQALSEPRLERAIGVIYRPETERQSHYFHARMPDQFDAVLHFDRTMAVQPLDRCPEWDAGELPETFPTGI
jgi:erythromycin esterase-like protein